MSEVEDPTRASRTHAISAGGERLRIREVGRETLDTIRRLNVAIFGAERVIETFDRTDLVMLLAERSNQPVGFKIGYCIRHDIYYSAKGGVLPAYRRQGIARQLLCSLMNYARAKGYRRFAYDTFPNKHAGMTILGLVEGFRVTRADYNDEHEDYHLRLEKEL